MENTNMILQKVEDPETKELLQEIFDADDASKEEQKKKIDEIKKSNNQKEVFDIQKFGEIYSLKGDNGEPLISPEIIDEYEVEYYLKNPNLNTLQEYAEYRKKLDSQEGN